LLFYICRRQVKNLLHLKVKKSPSLKAKTSTSPEGTESMRIRSQEPSVRGFYFVSEKNGPYYELRLDETKHSMGRDKPAKLVYMPIPSNGLAGIQAGGSKSNTRKNTNRTSNRRKSNRRR